MKNYFPIFKSREGELKGLNMLAGDVKRSIAPIIELLPETHETVLVNLTECWTFEDNEILIDCSFNPGTAQVETTFEALVAANVNVVPVVNLNSPEDYINFVADFIDEHDKKVCIRVKNEFARPRIFNALIQETIASLRTNAANIILLFDLSYASVDTYQNLANSVITNIKALAVHASEWGQIVVAAGSFPVDLSPFVANTRNVVPRYEWNIWQEIQNDNEINGFVYYSDYGIKHPIYDPTVGGFQATSSIKYTTSNDYLIYRGIRPGDHVLGGGQYHEKCRLLIADALYDGRRFSIADNEIFLIGNRNERPGNAGTWVKIGQSRHVSKIHSLLL
jgi:hypothetical protein